MRRRALGILAVLLIFVALPLRSAPAQHGSVLDRLPATPDPRAHYVIYLHGRIIEDQGRRPTHDTWGVYEYPQILETLAAEGLVVVSEQRKPQTDMDAYAAHVAGQVRTLLAASVPPAQVSVVGFSKGGGIAIRTSALLRNPSVNFVFLAACGDGDFSGSDLKVSGRILSVYEASDDIGRSCASLFAKPGATGERSEVRIDIGGGHGAFYRPRREWVDPVTTWVRPTP
jgi:hypothetical protein